MPRKYVRSWKCFCIDCGKLLSKNAYYYGYKRCNSCNKKDFFRNNKISISGENNPFYGKHHSRETKKKIGKAERGENNPMFGVHRFGKDNPHYGKYHSEKSKEKIREKAIKHWQNPEYVEMMIKAQQTKPNKAELKLNSILQEILPKEYAINVLGDKLILGGKIPDFANINGQKKIIEMFGDYWHTIKADSFIKTEEGRRQYFKNLGWDTLIIWEHELKNVEQLKQRIVEFNEV